MVTDGRTAGASISPSPSSPQAWANDPALIDEAIDDWTATLDALEGVADVGPGPVGYWGLSMGTILGLPFVATEPRITAAVLGLMGLTGPTKERHATDAAKVCRPVHFVVQWDDELFTRGNGRSSSSTPWAPRTSGSTPDPGCTRPCRGHGIRRHRAVPGRPPGVPGLIGPAPKDVRQLLRTSAGQSFALPRIMVNTPLFVLF